MPSVRSGLRPRQISDLLILHLALRQDIAPDFPEVQSRLQRYRRISLAVECCELAADTVYLVREAQSGMVLWAGWASQVRLWAVLRRSRLLHKDIVGVISVPDDGLCRTVARIFPGIPHQYCHDALLDRLMESLKPGSNGGAAALPVDAVKSLAEILRREGRSAEVATLVDDHLLRLRAVAEVKPVCQSHMQRLENTVRAWWPGLFHCYDVRQLPSTCSTWRETWQALRQTPGAGRSGSLGCEDILRRAWETRALPRGTLRLLDEIAARRPFRI
ncbi:MAG TPA: hypothetical protein VGO93_26780 [Candidatus Xenobia bacterium]|jgi:hypothetical protein